MTYQNLFRSIAITTVISLGAAGAANADAFAGNYQDRVLPSTTRHTTPNDQAHPAEYYARAVENNARVEAGNYQDHVVPHATRHDADLIRARGGMTAPEVAKSNPAY